MNPSIESDYLIIGAGTAGMAFTDALLAHSDATVTLVDRRHTPGGHWLDAYPFVRLHQPSAFYGVASVPLGTEAIDRSGFNEGFYEMAGADELRAYYQHVMRQHFLPTGRVHYVPCSDYGGGASGTHRFSSRLTGETREVRVRRKLIDTTYLEGRVPATSAPPFEVADGVRCIPAGEVPKLDHGTGRFAVVGAGKTALDTCVWLLSQGVEPQAIRWIKPRESWWLNRRFHQPHTLLPDFCAGVGMQLQAMAEACSAEDVFARLEADGFLLRVDRSVAPGMMRGAILSETELALLRQIEDVVRLGHVQRVEHDRIVLEQGTLPADADTVYLHCAAYGLARPPLRPIFEPDRVTVQPCFWGFASFQFALLGVVEALLDDVAEKNRLCPPVHYWDAPTDYLSAYLALLRAERARAAYPAIANWAKETRLNPLAGIARHRDDPAMVQAFTGIKRFGAAAGENLAKLLAVQG
jgi:hypothetical protein